MKKLSEFFYTDSYVVGIFLAFAIPIVSAIPIFPLINLMKSFGWLNVHFPISKYLLLCCIPNFIVFRQYIKVLQIEKTGKAIFLVSLIQVIALMILSNRGMF